MAVEKKKVVKKKTAKKKTVKKKSSAGSDKKLVIVESPAKSKTINKILGSQYKVIASLGHIADLPEGKMGIDFDNGFKPEYVVMRGRNKQLKAIQKEAKNSGTVYLAADPDREGEAICWHLKNYLQKANDQIYRVRFSEITEKAVKVAFTEAGKIDMNLVNAQQARRLLDRIVGYSISPLLWKMITRGLSAGRVQSVSVKLIVEREEEIRNFKPQEYWSLEALLSKTDDRDDEASQFKAKLIKHKGEKIHISDRIAVDEILDVLNKEQFRVSDISRKTKKSYPRAPYTTSVLQQDAFNKLNFSASKTMKIAQGLYEGVELGTEGSVGLITYMRTDSVRISDDAVASSKEYIISNYGDKYYPEKMHKYATKKRTQEGHEAIRPTLPLRRPSDIQGYLSKDEFKLYEMIWKRFIGSQMKEALYSVLAVIIDAGEYTFRAGGSELIFDGYLKLYQGDDAGEEALKSIPPLEEGNMLFLMELFPDQHFTKAPPRYSDASLVKILEEKGIGRPSTYAPIIRTIISRNYVKRVQRYFQPTELGELVNSFLLENFDDIVDYEFTARMENDLDYVEEGKRVWVDVLKYFYEPFLSKVNDAKERIKNQKKKDIKTDEICDKCGRHFVIKWGRKGKFLSCSGFPECRNAKSISTGVKCPEEDCPGELVERKSRRGAFYGCTEYPKCTYTAKNLPKQDGKETEGVEDD